MKQIRQVAGIVRGILEEHPDTRNSDNLLFIKVVESIDSDLLYKPMMDVLVHAKEYGIPPFESVRRSRQKLQEKFPELRGSKEVEAGREEKEQHPEYAVTGGFLKHIEKESERQKWWDNLSDEDKNIVMNLPNFDKGIFKEITGITIWEEVGEQK